MSGPEDEITQLVLGETFHVEDLLERIRSILRTYDSIDRTPLKDKTEDGANYILKVRRPDGTVIDILVPVEGHYDIKNGSSFGLNLVTDGHYA